MDPSPIRTSSSTKDVSDDEWDAEGFVIPSLSGEEAAVIKPVSPVLSGLPKSSPKVIKEEKIYLGPHGAPPRKTQEVNSANRKQRQKHRLEEADKRFSGSGRENKVQILRELVGSKGSVAMPKGSSNDWLDPHCHEAQFQKSAR